MRERCGGTEENQRPTAKIHLREAGADEVGDFLFGHTFSYGCVNLAVDVEGGFAGEAHEFEFMRGFERAAGDGDGIGGDAFKTRSRGAKVIVESEGKSFLDADAAGAEVVIGETSGDELAWAFVFLPDADFDWEAELFAGAALFEGGRDKDGLAGARKDQRE